MLKPYKRAELQFDVLREIGQEGKNSTAYLVSDLQLDTEIVMKRIPKAEIASQSEYFAEAKTLHATTHQNVVPILYACEDSDFIYIALPFFKRGSLKALLIKRNLTVREIVQIGCQLLSGLHNIHAKNLIHFDIKPDNVLLSDRGEALLSDFGLAKQMYLGRANQERFYVPIVAPEAIKSAGPFDLRFDIYQFGLTLYRMCRGEDVLRQHLETFITNGDLDRQQFADSVLNETYPDRSIFPEHIPDRLRRVVLKCLKSEPDERFQSALSVANELGKVDQCLDWRFDEGANGKSWSRSDGVTEKRFTIHPNGSTEFVATKGGRQRRTRDHCCKKMTEASVRRVLKNEA